MDTSTSTSTNTSAKEIKRLERLTVNWYPSTSEVINVVIFNNEYYCVDDPSLLDSATATATAKVRVIAEVKNEEELYKEYARNIVRAPLNPFALLQAYRAGSPITKFLPPRIQEILKASSNNIPDEVIEALNKHIMHYHCITSVDIGVLEAIHNLFAEFADNRTVLDKILEYIESFLDKEEGAYPDKETLYIGVKLLLREELKKRRQEEAIRVGVGVGTGIGVGTVAETWSGLELESGSGTVKTETEAGIETGIGTVAGRVGVEEEGKGDRQEKRGKGTTTTTTTITIVITITDIDRELIPKLLTMIGMLLKEQGLIYNISVEEVEGREKREEEREEERRGEERREEEYDPFFFS